MENQNRAYQLEIEKIKLKVEAEKQKYTMILVENEKLNDRINQLVNANQSNENLGAEKYRQLEY
jgi:Txe/YoeB family toxin of Txe-Axe toxin-antitoxin module